MASSFAAYVATSGQRDFDVTFPFINPSHVKVLVNGQTTPVLEWVSQTRLRLQAPLAGGESVFIQRETPITEALVKFQDGNVLTKEDLNTAVEQLLYKQQETSDLYERSLKDAQQRLADNLGVVTTPEEVADELAQLVLQTDVLANFQTRTADIDLNAESILQQATEITALTDDLAAETLARAGDVSSLQTSVGSLSTSLTTLQGDVQTLEGIVDGLTDINGEGISTVIANEQQARIDADNAIASELDLIGAMNGPQTAFILNLNTVKVSTTETLSQRLTALTAKDNSTEARIATEETARASADTALSSRIDVVSADVATARAEVVAETNARANGDVALAERIDLIGAENDGGTAFVLNLTTVQVTAGETLGARLSALQSSIDGNAAAITAEQTARTNADNAEATARTALAARVTTAENDIDANAAAIVAEQTARADADSAEASARTALAARVTTAEGSISANSAAITSEQAARASADSAIAADVSSLTTTVNGHTASISTVQTSLNGVSARYGVALNVDGHVTGFVQNNDGTSGDFIIVADKFAIVQPGATPYVPFEVSGGVVRIKEAAIGSLSIGKLTTGTLTAPVTQNADWTVGTGRIIWDNGTFMKVSGVGFGTTNQFIEWFGPKMAVGSCSEANAITYLKTNGDAYFGGNLSAGVLRNAAQTSDTGAAATVTIGPFGSNGAPISVVTSYSIQSAGTTSYAADTAGVNAWVSACNSWGATMYGSTGSRYVDQTKAISCNVVVRVDRNGSTGWATLTITGGTERIEGSEPAIADDTPGFLTYTRTVSGSLTSTDSVGGTTNRTFTATITTRTNATNGTIVSQRVGLVSTEE